MSSDHSPAGSNASQNPLGPDKLNISGHNRAYGELIIKDGSDEVMAGTGPDRQSVPANEVVNEASTEPKSDTVSSLIRLMIQQQEAQAESAARRAREEARIREEESMQRRTLLLKLAQILDGKESTASPTISTEKTSYIGVVYEY